MAAQLPSKPPELVRVFKGHTNSISAVHFHPQMHQLLSSSYDGRLYVWHFKPQLRPFKFQGHKAEVNDVSLSKDGNFFASASSDKTVNIWMNSSKGVPIQKIKAHTNVIRSCNFSHDSSMLVTGGDDKIVKVWQVTPSSCKFVMSLEGHTHWVRSTRFSQDDSNLVTSCGDDKSVRIWDLRVGSAGSHGSGGGKDRGCVFKVSEHLERVSRAIFHPDGTCIASCSHDRTIKIWDLRRRRLIQHYDAHSAPVTDVDFCPNSRSSNFLASSSVDRNIKLWDLQEGRLLYTMAGHEDTVTSVKFSPQAQFLASGSVDNKLFIWNTGLSYCSLTSANSSAGTSINKSELKQEPVERLLDAPAKTHEPPFGARPYLYSAPTRNSINKENDSSNTSIVRQKKQNNTVNTSQISSMTASNSVLNRSNMNKNQQNTSGINTNAAANTSILTSTVDHVNGEPMTSHSPKIKKTNYPSDKNIVVANANQGNVRENQKPIRALSRPAFGSQKSSMNRNGKIAAPRGNTNVTLSSGPDKFSDTNANNLTSPTNKSKSARLNELNVLKSTGIDRRLPCGTTVAPEIKGTGSAVDDISILSSMEKDASLTQAIRQMSSQLAMISKTVQMLNKRVLLTEEAVTRLER